MILTKSSPLTGEWVTFNFFCPPVYWNQIFKKIEVLLIKFKNDIDTDNYNIEFNYFTNEYFSLALIIDSENRDNITDYIQHQFNLFNLSPNNKVNILKSKQSDNSTLFSAISYSMIKMLKNEEINNETILALAFQLNIIVFKSFLKKEPLFKKALAAVTLQNNTNTNYQYLDILHNQFQENRVFLEETADKILIENNIPKWLNKWMNACDYEINRKSHYRGSLNDMFIYGKITYAIFKHLGIDNSHEMFLSYFVQQIINKYQLTNSAN